MIYKLSKINIILVIINSILTFSPKMVCDTLDNFVIRENLRRHSYALASDSMLGRGNGQKGLDLAAKYILNELAKITVNQNNIIKQNIPVIEVSTLQNTEFEIENSLGSKFLSLNSEYLVHSTGLMSYFPSALEIVFVRYGIFAPEFDYNDYHNIDVSGKVVLILEGEPNGFYNNQVPTRHSLIETKQRTALSRGAIAVIIIPDIALHSVHTWEYLESQYNSPEYNLAFSPSSILTIIINPQLVGLIFDQQLSSEKQFDYISHQNSVLLSSKFIFKGKYRDKSFQISNLLFKIEGHDSRLKDECVIISAHYDHLGIGPVVNHDSIYNGFMDNALGCAALLELSRLLFTDQKELKRTILLIFTAGEERGLLGSRYYTNNPILPLYKTIANINIDGVAFIDNFASVTGIGASFSSLKEILDKTAYENGLFVDTLQGFSDDLEAFNRSDQVAFAYAGIPSILVIDAVNYKNINKEYGFAKLEEYFSDIYHTPFDDTSQFINWDASSQHTDFLVKFVRNIINLNISPEWYPDNRFYLERLRTKAEKR